ncbi:MAG: TatD family hydrolase [Clostridia bacterium]|nr:TatD family hydrolase [Clostridia bacterium]
MYNNIFDSHAHYDDERFSEDLHTLLADIQNAGVSHIVNCATNLSSAKKCIELSKKYPFIYTALGVHPHECSDAAEDELDQIEKLLSHNKCVAVGEIGLDYHYDFSPRELQLEFFEKQLILANKYNLPVIVHDREAHADTMALLKKYKPKGVVHCFSGSVETAKEVVALGMYIGLGGAVTFKNAKKPLEVAAFVPDEMLLLETDCPYMSPVPFRGKRNDSTLIPYTAQTIAQVKDMDIQQLLNITNSNAKKLFSISD